MLLVNPLICINGEVVSDGRQIPSEFNWYSYPVIESCPGNNNGGEKLINRVWLEGFTTRFVGADNWVEVVGEGEGIAPTSHLKLITTFLAWMPVEFTFPLKFLVNFASRPNFLTLR